MARALTSDISVRLLLEYGDQTGAIKDAPGQGVTGECRHHPSKTWGRIPVHAVCLRLPPIVAGSFFSGARRSACKQPARCDLPGCEIDGCPEAEIFTGVTTWAVWRAGLLSSISLLLSTTMILATWVLICCKVQRYPGCFRN